MDLTLKAEKYTIYLDGGLGRIVCAIPALERFVKNNPETKIVTYAIELFLDNQLLIDHVFSPETKGLWDSWIKDSTYLVPEPYQNKEYYNQRAHLIQAFDIELNGDNSGLGVTTIQPLNTDLIYTRKAIDFAFENYGKKSTVVFQPTGRGFDFDSLIDPSSRSIVYVDIISILETLSKDYNVILMVETDKFDNPEKWYRPDGYTPRQWSSIIGMSNYFIGCDSFGQHLARGMGVPGTVVLGSTFKENVTYPDWFNVIETDKSEVKYSPLRTYKMEDIYISAYNNSCMNFPEGYLVFEIDKHMKQCGIVKGGEAPKSGEAPVVKGCKSC